MTAFIPEAQTYISLPSLKRYLIDGAAHRRVGETGTPGDLSGRILANIRTEDTPEKNLLDRRRGNTGALYRGYESGDGKRGC